MSSMKPIHARAWADWEINVPRSLMYCHGGAELAEGRQRLFEKALTPSDVGKLNRLVIPKQHAEKHFPLDGESGEKGLLMSFEDESGKPWRFRYSYWRSSQSYVLTKGWSRFVKEKKLDTGDVVFFERLPGRGAGDRLSIRCRRRRRCSSEDAEESPPPEPQPPAAALAAAPATAPMQSRRRLRLFGVNLDCTLETTTAAIDASAADQSLQYEI